MSRIGKFFVAAPKPVIPPPTGTRKVAMWGDSNVARGQDTDGIIVRAANHLNGLGQGTYVTQSYNAGWGGDWGRMTSARFGGEYTTVVGSALVLPSANPVGLGTVFSLEEWTKPLKNDTEFNGVIAGYFALAGGVQLRATITKNFPSASAGSPFYAKREVNPNPAGTSTTIPIGTAFVMDEGKTYGEFTDWCPVFEAGGNDVGAAMNANIPGYTLETALTNAIKGRVDSEAKVAAGLPFMQLGGILLPFTPIGSSTYDAQQQFNTRLRAASPTRVVNGVTVGFFDWMNRMVNEGYELAGVTPTQEDLDYRAQGTVGYSLVENVPPPGHDIHFNPEGRIALGKIVGDQMLEWSWFG